MALVRGETPALVLRRRYNPAHCAALMSRFYERGLLYDPHETGDRTPHRVDIGTSFGQHRVDRKAFFAHAAATRKLFATLFEGYDDPVDMMYESLALLAPDKEIKIAREADGSLYGPAIFRVYHAGLGHGPHFDSVARRTKAFDYAISRFQYQLAAVLCFQSSGDTGDSGEAFIHNCPPTSSRRSRNDPSPNTPGTTASNASTWSSNRAISTSSSRKTSTKCLPWSVTVPAPYWPSSSLCPRRRRRSLSGRKRSRSHISACRPGFAEDDLGL